MSRYLGMPLLDYPSCCHKRRMWAPQVSHFRSFHAGRTATVHRLRPAAHPQIMRLVPEQNAGRTLPLLASMLSACYCNPHLRFALCPLIYHAWALFAHGGSCTDHT